MLLSCVQLFVTQRTVVSQAPQSMEFSRPESWRGVAFPFSNGSSQQRDWTQVSHTAGRFLTSWATRDAQEDWSGWPTPSPAELSDPEIKLAFPALEADSLPAELPGKVPGKGVFLSPAHHSPVSPRAPYPLSIPSTPWAPWGGDHGEGKGRGPKRWRRKSL